MADYTVANGTDAALSNINAANEDVPARNSVSGVTLTNAELAAVVALNGVAVMQDAATFQERRAAARVLKYRKASLL